jgi:hypothetical protein
MSSKDTLLGDKKAIKEERSIFNIWSLKGKEAKDENVGSYEKKIHQSFQQYQPNKNLLK